MNGAKIINNNIKSAMKVLVLAFFILGGSGDGDGVSAAASDITLQGIPSPSSHILNEYSSSRYNSNLPLQITSNVPVTIQRYTPNNLENLIQDGEIPKILVTSNCDTSQTTAGSVFTPTITQGSGVTNIDINLPNVGTQLNFLQSSSYDVTWKEWGCGFFTADQIDNFPGINQNQIDIIDTTTPTACLTKEECNEKRLDMNIATFRVGRFPTAGCFSKNGVAYWSTSSTSINDLSTTNLPGVRERIMCEKKVSTDPGGGGGNEEEELACRTQLECDTMRQEMGIGSFRVGEYPNTSGCFAKNGIAYWSTRAGDESTTDLPGVQERIMCNKEKPAVGVCETNNNCGGVAAKFCRLENGVCNNVGSNNVVAGVCDVMPEMCAEIYDPVCGCDKKTYSNECSAHSKGQNVDTIGECEAAAGGGSTGTEEEQRACLTELECDTKRQEMSMGFRVGSYPTKGCFSKNGVAYWSTGGSIQDKSTAVLPGMQERIWCGGNMRSSGSSSAHQQTNPGTSQVQQQEIETTNSACSSISKPLILGSLLKKALSSQANPVAPHHEQARSLQSSCTYNVEFLLGGCNLGQPTEIKVEAPKARVIDSDIDIVDKETMEVTESMLMDGEQLYNVHFKYIASMLFPNDKAVSVPVNTGSVPSLEEGSCAMIVCGRPFIDTSGDSLLASVLPSDECGLIPTSSWLGNTISVSNDEKSVVESQLVSVGNATRYQYEQLGEKWTRNALAEHASIASFAAFSLALMSNGAPSHLVESAMKAGLDEIKHAKISFTIASKLMGKEISPGPLPPSKHEFNNNMTALAMAVAKEGCVDETLSSLEAAAEVDLIDYALNNGVTGGTKYYGISSELLVYIRDELRIIALDESIHSSLAWKTLEWVCSVSKDACDAAKQNVLGESKLILAFQYRFGHSNDYNSELLGRMLKAWKSIYTSQYGPESISNVDEPSLLSQLVDNVLSDGSD